MVLDFEETLMRQGFNFINPNSHQELRLRLQLLRLKCIQLTWDERER